MDVMGGKITINLTELH